MIEDEMVGWHHGLNGHEFEQPLGDVQGQGRLVCCSPWGHEELDTAEGLNSNNNIIDLQHYVSSRCATSIQFSSVPQSCPTLCDPMNCSTPGHPVHHQLLEFTQTHVHQVSDAIQPSHPLSSPSPPAPNPSQLQSLFQ